MSNFGENESCEAASRHGRKSGQEPPRAPGWGACFRLWCIEGRLTILPPPAGCRMVHYITGHGQYPAYFRISRWNVGVLGLWVGKLSSIISELEEQRYRKQRQGWGTLWSAKPLASERPCCVFAVQCWYLKPKIVAGSQQRPSGGRQMRHMLTRRSASDT